MEHQKWRYYFELVSKTKFDVRACVRVYNYTHVQIMFGFLHNKQ